MKCCTLKEQICLLLQFHSSNHCLLQYNYSNIVLSMKTYSIWEEFDFLLVTAFPQVQSLSSVPGEIN